MILSALSVLTLSLDQRRDDDLHEEVEEEPAVDDPPKKARPGRACDNCRRKKVSGPELGKTDVFNR